MTGAFWALLAVFILGLVIMGIGAGGGSKFLAELLVPFGAIIMFAAVYTGLETLTVGEFIAFLSIIVIGFFLIWNVGEWLLREKPAPHHKIT